MRLRRLRALAVLAVLVVVSLVSVQLFRYVMSDPGSEAQVAQAPVSAPASSEPAASFEPAPSEPADEAPAETSAPVEQPAAPTAEAAAAALEEAAEKRMEEISGRLSMSVLDLSTGVAATYGPSDRTHATASIVKVDILATLLWQNDGKLSESERSLARRMIQQSDNSAATALWRSIGRASGLAEANEKFGLTSTTGGSAGYWGLTTTTTSDQTQLLKNVFTEDSALNLESRRYLKSLMGSVASDQDWGVSAADTRAGEKYYVKNGWLPRSKGWVVNSIGSVDHEGHQLLIVALSDGGDSMDENVQVVEELAEDAAKAVTGL